MNAVWRAVRPDRLTLASFAVLTIVVVGIIAAPHVTQLCRDGLEATLAQLYDAALYSRVVIRVDYFHDGFVRRGLSGTLLALMPVSPQRQIFWFVAGSLVFLLVPLALLVRRLVAGSPALASAYLIATLLLSPQTFLAWSHDLVRTDLLVAGFLAWAMLFAVRRNWGLSIAAIVTGFLVHETAFLFGAGLLTAALWLDSRDGALRRSRAIALASTLAGTVCGLALLQAAATVDGATLAQRLVEAFPTSHDGAIDRDVAVYMAAGGLRALKTAMCYNFSLDQGYALKCLFGIGLIALYLVILPTRKHLYVCAAAILAPTLFLMVVANDIGRWLMLAVFCTWLMSAFIVIRESGRVAVSSRATVAGAVVIAVLLMGGYTPYNDVNLAARELIAAQRPNTVNTLEEWLARCDPEWRTIVYGR
jgi:hypothetical protein